MQLKRKRSVAEAPPSTSKLRVASKDVPERPVQAAAKDVKLKDKPSREHRDASNAPRDGGSGNIGGVVKDARESKLKRVKPLVKEISPPSMPPNAKRSPSGRRKDDAPLAVPAKKLRPTDVEPKLLDKAGARAKTAIAASKADESRALKRALPPAVSLSSTSEERRRKMRKLEKAPTADKPGDARKDKKSTSAFPDLPEFAGLPT